MNLFFPIRLFAKARRRLSLGGPTAPCAACLGAAVVVVSPGLFRQARAGPEREAHLALSWPLGAAVALPPLVMSTRRISPVVCPALAGRLCRTDVRGGLAKTSGAAKRGGVDMPPEAISLIWRMPWSARIKSKMIVQRARRCLEVRRSAWRSDASAAIW